MVVYRSHFEKNLTSSEVGLILKIQDEMSVGIGLGIGLPRYCKGTT